MLHSKRHTITASMASLGSDTVSFTFFDAGDTVSITQARQSTRRCHLDSRESKMPNGIIERKR